jgi:hypothetical protein
MPAFGTGTEGAYVSATGNTGPRVDNPWRGHLLTLKADLQREMGELSGLLARPCADIGEGSVWVGPAADTWHREAEARRRDMLAQLRALVPLVETAIRTCPEKVTIGEAKLLQADLL